MNTALITLNTWDLALQASGIKYWQNNYGINSSYFLRAQQGRGKCKYQRDRI